MKKRSMLVLLAGLLACLLCGCLFQSVDELYALPRQTEEYYNLQAELDELLKSGAQYSAPVAGENQQSVQMADLDGDGVNEVIAFFHTDGDEPLKVCIYAKQNGAYANVAVLEHMGSAFDRVEYVQLDGQPGLEMVVGTQVSDQVLQSLRVYRMDADGMTQLLSTNYFQYTTADLDSDGLSELVSFRPGEDGAAGVAEIFVWDGEQLRSDGTARMSIPLTADSICRVNRSNTQPDVPAVFVTSTYNQMGLVTDVFARKDGVFTNIALDPESSASLQIVPTGSIFATDLDDDGLMELPSMLQLQKYDETDPTSYYLTNWYNLTLDGEKVVKTTTYYNVNEGWYLTIPDAWSSNFLVDYAEDESGYAGYSFYLYTTDPQEAQRIATIYPFYGSDAAELAAEDGRFVIGQKGSVVFAATLGDALDLDEENLSGLFHFIQEQWNSGQMRQGEGV